MIYASEARKSCNTDYIYLGNTQIAQRHMAWGTGTITVEYQHTDALGSPVAQTNASGQVIERTDYNPWGEVYAGGAVDGPGYTGHVMDAATKLIYMQQRFYDPVTGRFPSVDPMEADTTTGWNFSRYTYAANNPYKFTDPDGRLILNALGAGIGAVVGGGGAALITAIRGGSAKEIAASALGGAVGGAITGATLGAGAPQGAIVAAGIVGGIAGEATTQTVTNAVEHKGDFASYEYSGPDLAVSGAVGAADAMTGGLVSEVAGPALKEGTKALATEAALLPVKTTVEMVKPRDGKNK